MKSVKKTFLMLCIALSVFMCNSTSAFAAVCEKSEDGVHHFSNHHRHFTQIYSEDGGSHMYLYGYDQNNKPIYRYDCYRKLSYYWCNYACAYCDTEDARHSHYATTSHSVNHN
jgi:hypothetical protein